jgi:Uridine kinase
MPSILPYTALVAHLRGLVPSCGDTRIVAVDGPAGSGKTTFAGRLAAASGAQVIHSDEFPVPWDGPPDAWFAPLTEQVLGPLAQGRPGRFRRYDWVRGEHAEQVEVPPAPVLIVEGVAAARRATAHLLAFTVWVEAPDELRLRRGLARDGAHLREQWEHWMRTEREWFARDDTASRADLSVDGAPSVPHDPSAEFVVLHTNIT